MEVYYIWKIQGYVIKSLLIYEGMIWRASMRDVIQNNSVTKILKMMELAYTFVVKITQSHYK